MGRKNQSDIEDDGVAAGADVESLSDEKTTMSSPGSLLSLKIRKRSAGSPARAAATPPPPPTSRPTSKVDPDAATPSSPTSDPDSVLDPIARVTRRARFSPAARPPQPPRVPVVPQPRPRATSASARAQPGPELATRISPSRTSDIVAYWARLRGGRRYPRSGEIDSATVADSWPNSILIRCRPGSRALEPEKMYLAGDGISPRTSGLRGGGRVNLSPMMLQWLLGLAGEVVREGRPMNDVETFPSVKTVVHYRAVALPFSDNENAVDHVLCHFRPDA